MATLTVTSRGQVTFRKDILRHLGISAGEKLDLDMLPGGCVTLRAARASGSIEHFIGALRGRSGKAATLDDIDEAISAAWAGET